jgi:hypothetical protein
MEPLDLILWILKGFYGLFLGMVMFVWVLAPLANLWGTDDEDGEDGGMLAFCFIVLLSIGLGLGYWYFLVFHAALWMWVVATGAYLYAALNGLAGPYDLKHGN